jgi:hypothetical protein
MCYSCNKPGHVKRDCPDQLEKTQCHGCQKYGHFQANCPQIELTA